MTYYPIEEFERDIAALLHLINSNCSAIYHSIYGIPRGGWVVAMKLAPLLGCDLTDDPHKGGSVLVVDDIVDSGTTRKQYSSFDFASLHIRDYTPGFLYPTYYASVKTDWVDYFWEKGEKMSSIEDTIIRQLQFIGEDPTRDGLQKTPSRVLRSWNYLFKGYKEDPLDYIRTFDMAEYNQMVLLKNIEIYSMCEHHMLPFFGRAHVAYIPGKSRKVIGVSKLARILETFARRLQIQERIGEQVTSFLMENIQPVGAACIIEADHLCMRMRGVEKQNSVMVTSSLNGVFLEDSDQGRAARAELMGLIR